MYGPAYVTDFPIRMTCFDECDSIMDDLFINHITGNKNGIAFLFQIVMTLVVYQKVYHFAHSNLHTNNMIFELTTKKYRYSIRYQIMDI